MEVTREFIEEYADQISPKGKWKQVLFFLGKYIPEKKLKNAVGTYADLSDGEVPLLLIDTTAFGSAKEGILLTTSNLYYNAPLKSDEKPQKGVLPLSEIQSVFFEIAKFEVSDSMSVKGTILHINSYPFAYLFGSSEPEKNILNDIFGKLNTAEHIDITLLPKPKPVWAFDGEELIHEMSSYNINFDGSEYSRIFITNARIVRMIPEGGSVAASFNYTPELFFKAVELSEVRGITIALESFSKSKLVLELENEETSFFSAKHEVIKELEKYLRAALERVIPVVVFEDPDERFLFKKRTFTAHYMGAFCSEELWESVFGNTRIGARFCITNKRLLYYRIDQVRWLSDKVLDYYVSAPVFRYLWLPLSALTGITREKKGLSNITRLYVSAAPAGLSSPSEVVPDLRYRDERQLPDPVYINAISEGGSAVLNFEQWDRLSKKNRLKAANALKSNLPEVVNSEL